MGQANERHEAMLRSPENALGEFVPYLARFREHYGKCREGGFALHASARGFGEHAMDQAPYEGAPPGTDPALASLADRAAAAVRALLALWEANAVEGGHCVPVDAMAAHLAVLDDPAAAGWLEGGAAKAAFDARLLEAQEAATAERQAEQKAATRAFMAPGVQVAFCDIGGHPVGFGEVEGGSIEDGFRLKDGGVLVLHESSYSADWILERDGRRQGLSARPRQPLDERVVALRSGLLADDGTILAAGRMPLPRKSYLARSAYPSAGCVGARNQLDPERLVGELLPKGGYGNLFAYMTRRFGPPTVGSEDHYKTMCGAWVLSTPMPDLFLTVQPSPSQGDLSFSPLLSRAAASGFNRLERGFWDEVCGRTEGTAAGEAYLAFAAPYWRAMRATFLDLLRPVWVRDMPINATGRLRDDDPLCTKRHGAGYSETATTAFPIGFLDDGEALSGLLAALRRLDPADWGAAMRKMAELVPAPAPEEPCDGGGDPVPPGPR